MPLSEKLKRQIALLPDAPGVYLMKDEKDTIIYIGKAKNLKKRVSQYFLRPQEGKVLAMREHVDHFDFILVHSDKEAFILEMNLIQTHYPRYNIVMKDDSHYPYIALRKKDAYLSIARKKGGKDSFFFGPYPNSKDAYNVLRLLESLFPTRKCHSLQKKPCLYYHLGACLAPCVNAIPEADYESLYASIKSFLDGNVDEVTKSLKEKMLMASKEERFEDAAYYKGILDSVFRTVSKQTVELSSDRTDRDVFAYSGRDGYLSLAILTYRKGRLLGKKVDVYPLFGEEEEECSDLIAQYYQRNELPSEILCNIPSFDERFLPLYPEAKVVHPKEGRLLSVIDLASLNAKQGLEAHFSSARLEDDNLALLKELGTLLEIKTPYRIELFDNSHLQGSSAVGAMVCYINGEPSKGNYRKFRLKEENAGDDFHSMAEVVSRRYKRLKEEGLPFPDLILADGGLPQVEASLLGLEEAGVSIPVYGLYKNDRHQTEGIVDPSGKTYPLDPKSPLFFLLMRMQDEVHRFAITFHRSVRSKAMMASPLDGVKGLGESRKETIKKNYPTMEALLKASESELSQILPLSVAKALYMKIHRE